MTETLLFYGFGLLSILGALGLILFKHPMNGAMSFVITLISLACLYALLSAKLIFAIQLIVYAGAIMSLILFIIMFLNIGESDLPEERGRWFYLAGGIVAIGPIAILMQRAFKTLPPGETAIVGDGFGGVQEVGMVLFTDWLLPFEIVSILLLVALVGAVVLAGKREVSE
ncbi:MAG: NADH-quinone oxidoreductase subunit J [Desulfobulbaceae bacterium]|nr:MAG: NADH-quinone oxidoreductase subunit J [Desulfobulbaceae bacterium]